MRYLPLFSSSLFLAVTLAGCGDGGTGSTGSGGTTGTGGDTSTSTGGTSTTGTGGSPTSTSTGTSTGTGETSSDVTGTIIDTYVTEMGDQQSSNVAPLSLFALVPTGNGFTKIPGTIEPGGSFDIPKVPAGTYYLGLDTDGTNHDYVVTDQHEVDLGNVYAGRNTATQLTLPTPMLVNLTGMSAWQDTDSLEVFSQGAASGSDLLYAASEFPMAGDTSLVGLPVDGSQFFAPNQIEAAKGDTTFFTQLVSRSDGAFSYSSIGKSFKPAAFSLLDGNTTAVNGAFADVPQQTATFDWKRSLFGGLAASVNPGATLSSCGIYAYGEPGGPTRATNTYSPTILYAGDGASDDVKLTLSYGNPFPASWAAVAYVSATFSVPYLVPGTATMKHAITTVDVGGTITELTAGAVKPMIGPPSALLIGGKDGYAVNTGVGLSPVVSWSAPSLGTSALYQVWVRKVDATLNAGKSVARITTQGTSIRIPQDLLEVGASYFVRVTAHSSGSIKTPNKWSPTMASATAISGVFTP